MSRTRQALVALLLGVSGVLWASLATWGETRGLSEAMVVSLSSDGRYVISSHRERELVLWDIRARAHRVVSRNANAYSAYFIPGRKAFLWQDLSNAVKVQRIDDTVIQEFPYFPTYGHLISTDLATYIASTVRWKLFTGKTLPAVPLKIDGDSPSFLGTGKLLNLSLDARGQQLLSSGRGLQEADEIPINVSSALAPERLYSDYAGVVVWDLATGQPLHKLPGNAAKTHATLSPDGKFVVSVDENAHTFVWNVLNGQQVYEPALLGMGLYVGGHELGSLKNWDTNGMRLGPNDLPQDLAASAQLGVHFLDAEHYVILHTYQPYAVLYALGDPFALKILPLGEEPFPSVASYSRNAAIDSAPEAGILVTGQREGGGINVYRFDRRARSLERIWAPTP